MSNLLVTIISITLVAVAAIMAIFYGGTAYENANIQAMAAATITQLQQIQTAMTLYIVDHPGVDASTIGISDLVNNKYLSVWPNFITLPPQPNIIAPAY